MWLRPTLPIRKDLFEVARPGRRFKLYVNQAMRPATVLARIADRLLVEYEMPNGTTSILEISPTRDRNLSYRHVPLYWLKEMFEDGTEWIGEPQQQLRVDTPIKSVADTYLERIG